MFLLVKIIKFIIRFVIKLIIGFIVWNMLHILMETTTLFYFIRFRRLII